MKWTAADLKREFDHAKTAGWLATIQAEATANNFAPEILLGIPSRETNLTNERGDYRDGEYHGYGLFQVDIGTDREWCLSGKWRDPNEAIRKGVSILVSKRAEVLHASFDNLKDADVLRVSIAAYNCGTGPALVGFRVHDDPDRATTGHDYSADVLKRAAVFKSFLESDAPKGI